MTNPLNPHKPVKKRKNDLKHLVRLCHKIITAEDKIAKHAKKEKQDMRDGKIDRLFKDLKRKLQTDRRELSKCKKTALAAGTSAQDLTIVMRETKTSEESTHLQQILANEVKLTHFLYHLVHGKIIPLVEQRIQVESDEIKDVKEHDANALKQAMQKDAELSQELRKYKPIIEKIILHLKQLEKADQQTPNPIAPGSHHSKHIHQIALAAILILIIGVVVITPGKLFAKQIFNSDTKISIIQDNAQMKLENNQTILNKLKKESNTNLHNSVKLLESYYPNLKCFYGSENNQKNAINNAYAKVGRDIETQIFAITQSIESVTPIQKESEMQTKSNSKSARLIISADKYEGENIRKKLKTKTTEIIFPPTKIINKKIKQITKKVSAIICLDQNELDRFEKAIKEEKIDEENAKVRISWESYTKTQKQEKEEVVTSKKYKIFKRKNYQQISDYILMQLVEYDFQLDENRIQVFIEKVIKPNTISSELELAELKLNIQKKYLT